MARYVPEPAPFLTPQMLAMGSVLRHAQAGNGNIENVASAYSEVTDGDYTYTVVEEEYVAVLAGGPRAAIRYGITGPFVFAMEFGAERFPRSEASRGALRATVTGGTRFQPRGRS